MISTAIQNGRWLLVSSTTGEGSPRPGASGSKAETIELFWTGLAWSKQACDGKGFASQSEALSYRDQNSQRMIEKL